jgi:hypothetical protein
MSAIAPPRAPAPQPEALIPEARARTRRRRLRLATAALALAAAAFAIYDAVSGGGTTTALSAAPVPVVDQAAFSGHGVLAFVSQGRLWVLDGDTRTLRAVSAPGHQAAAPSFSPDHRWISYVVDSQTWVAAADGTGPHRVATSGAVGWLPDPPLRGAGGRLDAGDALWSISASGVPVRVGAAPADLVAWSANGGRYVFETSTLTVSPGRSSRGIERLAVASSLDGPRTTWLVTHVAFTPQSGLIGVFIRNVLALPGREGILVQLERGGGESASLDGLEIYELRAPGGRLAPLGIAVGMPVAIGAGGEFAIAAGPNRYAWLTKYILRCSAAAATCARVPVARGMLALAPAWSPGGATLAFAQAPSGTQGNIGQAAVSSWFAAHSLWTIPGGASRASEIPATAGATAPVWSSDGRSLLYVADDALWLLPALPGPPVRIAGPLFAPNDWPGYYGEVDWGGQFAWVSRAAAGGRARSAAA